MRCRFCDALLSDAQSVFKHPGTTTYADECGSCYDEGINDLEELNPTIDTEDGIGDAQ